MRGTGKKARHQEFRKSSLSNKESGSILIASLKREKGSKKVSRGYKHKSGSKSRNKLSKKMFDDRSSMGQLICHEQSLIVGAGGNGKGADKNGLIGKLNNRKNKRSKRTKVELDEPLRLQRRTRYLMIRMKLEQNLIDAYSGEGWKGQSREKIKPEKELIRAKKQILKCKLGLRDALRQLDTLSTVGCIEDSVIAPDGSVSHEHIFCAKCKLNEVLPDNDIILCDGTCNCAFHQKCLDPPLDTENIPPGDQGWFCKFCECRMEIIDAMNAHLGTHFSVESNWQDIFQQEAAFPDGGSMLLNTEEEWPSDDSKDDDYDPERRENISGAGTDDDASDDSNSTSLGWSSDNEVSSETRRWRMEGRELGNPSIYSSLDSDETSDGEVMYGRRQRRAVDYKKLYDEMFGKDAAAYEQVSEDEDWGPAKRRRREKESDAASTLMTLYESKKTGKETDAMGLERKLPRDPRSKRQCFRIPPDAVEKLRQVFAENELPSRPVKENLAKELGLEPRTVSKWFKNVRYLALKSRKAGKATRHYSRAKISGESRLDTVKNKTTWKDSSLETGSLSPENLRKVIRRKKPKSISSRKINELKRGSPGSPAKPNEANGEYTDDVSLKNLLKANAMRGSSRVDSDSAEASLASEAELERLCGAKVRLDHMKQTLMKLQLHNGKARNSNTRTHLPEESVVYVPIAELREKF